MTQVLFMRKADVGQIAVDDSDVVVLGSADTWKGAIFVDSADG